jgi:coenzyme F420-reducing hydrogenase delta subunit
MYTVNESSLKIDIFCCSGSIDPGELAYGNSGDRVDVKVIPLPCSGKIDILYLTKAFETGADGVAVVTCKKGECRYLEGNLRAQRRAEAVDALMEEIGLGSGRTVVIQIGEGGVEQVKREVEDLRSRIKASPRSAYSGDEQELDQE